MGLLVLALSFLAAFVNSNEERASVRENRTKQGKPPKICKPPSHIESILLWQPRPSECLKEDESDYVYAQFKNLLESRTKEITTETQKLWTLYKIKAWGSDYIKTDDGKGLNDAEMSMMIVENIDTMFFLGSRDMYDEAIQYLVDSMRLPDQEVNTSNIVKLLGAYLSAYDLSRWPGTLEKAKEIGEILLSGFSYKAEKLLSKRMNPVSKQVTKRSGDLKVGDVTQITELLKLWRITKDKRYYQLAESVSNWIYDKSEKLPSIPTNIKHSSRKNYLYLGGKIALDESGLATSRNLLNAYLASNQTLPRLKELYNKQKQYFINSLALMTNNNLLFIAEKSADGKVDYKMHEAACGWPGQLAIENLIFGYNSTEVNFALKLLNTCLEMHAITESSLPAEYTYFKKTGIYYDKDSFKSYKLTSYVVESLLHMWRLTHDAVRYI
jgi:hypothetical protein